MPSTYPAERKRMELIKLDKRRWLVISDTYGYEFKTKRKAKKYIKKTAVGATVRRIRQKGSLYD